MPVRNIRLLLAYDGTEFHGWQTQADVRTVQEVVEQAVRRVVRHQVGLTGSGRTDAGVHAVGQVANFRTECDIPCENLRRAIGSRLPKDVSVFHAREVPPDFQACRSPLSKLYRYTIYNHPNRPVERHRQAYVYHVWHPLDIEAMRAAARYMIGTYDCSAFATRGSERENTVRTILQVRVERCYEEIRIDVEGTGFLYNQVRNMVGTLLEVGRGHWPPERVGAIIAGRDRSQAGPTVPARGLCLQWVRYDLPALAADAVENPARFEDSGPGPDGAAPETTLPDASA